MSQLKVPSKSNPADDPCRGCFEGLPHDKRIEIDDCVSRSKISVTPCLANTHLPCCREGTPFFQWGGLDRPLFYCSYRCLDSKQSATQGNAHFTGHALKQRAAEGEAYRGFPSPTLSLENMKLLWCVRRKPVAKPL